MIGHSLKNRLIADYETHGNLIIAVDFDHTIYKYSHEWNHIQSAISVVKRAHSLGMQLYCFTANENHAFVNHYITNEIGIPGVPINNSPLDSVFDSRKPYYNLLLDDRAGNLKKTIKTLNKVLDYIEFYSTRKT